MLQPVAHTRPPPSLTTVLVAGGEHAAVQAPWIVFWPPSLQPVPLTTWSSKQISPRMLCNCWWARALFANGCCGGRGEPVSACIGLIDGKVQYTPFADVVEQMDFVHRRAKAQPWMAVCLSVTGSDEAQMV
jgi:hypothetical protein